MRLAKKNVTNIEELNKWLEGTRKIKFVGKKQSFSVKEIYQRISNTGEMSNPTCYLTDTIQSDRGKYRSMNDLLLLIKHYHPTKSISTCLKDVCRIYYQQCNEGKYGSCFWYCPNIRRHNFRGTTYLDLRYRDALLKRVRSDFKKEFTSIPISDFNKFFDDIHKACI